MTCPTCTHADLHGSWPSEVGTHCYECHRSWQGKAEVHCAGCHLSFSSHTSADLHDPYCHPDMSVTRKRLLSARRRGGNPLLATRVRRDGEIFVSWSSRDRDKPWGGEAA